MAQANDVGALALLLLSPRAGWRRTGARCAAADVDPETFFPGRGKSADRARELCATCPVQAQCLGEALSVPGSLDVHRVWGGSTEKDRRRLRRLVRHEDWPRGSLGFAAKASLEGRWGRRVVVAGYLFGF